MTDLLELSAHYIDREIFEGPRAINPMTGQLAELRPGIAMVQAFSHVICFDTEEGLVLFDTSLQGFAARVIEALRGWSKRPVHTIAYTHGHIDHVGGAQAFLDEARHEGRPPPRVVGHQAVAARFDRYQQTLGYNAVINRRQFLGRGDGLGAAGQGSVWGPDHWVRPDLTFNDRLSLRVGGLDIELRHARGETDDHLWAWLPAHRAICAGDFVIWMFPNAGNPQKVQRYPREWARALREMVALEPELLLPAHGLPVSGVERVRGLLATTADALDFLVDGTLELMNEGATLNDILHTLELPERFRSKPYLQPFYDEPEFVVHNIWRLYGGWYDGNPAHLKPARDAELARELVALIGGVDPLLVRARERADAQDFRVACHLVELAVQAAPEHPEAHAARAELYQRRRKAETSLMAKGIFTAAAAESEAKLQKN